MFLITVDLLYQNINKNVFFEENIENNIKVDCTITTRTLDSRGNMMLNTNNFPF